MHIRGRTRRSVPVGWGLIGLVLVCCLFPAYPQVLWPEDEQRLHVGLKLLPAFLAADQDLAAKATPEGRILVLVVHRDAPESALDVVAELRRVEKIGELPIKVEIIRTDQLASYQGTRVAGIFLSTPDAGGQDLESWAERFHALVFSPFVGDVERGAVAGIYVAERILPYVNPDQAQRAGIRFKPFFLKVAKPYE